MEIIYLLIPLAVVLAAVIVWAFFWSVKSGQFDDLEGPAHRILIDDEPAGKTSDSPDKSAAQGSAGCGAEGRKFPGD